MTALAAAGCMVNPYGPVYTGTPEEMATVEARRQAALDERAQVEWWRTNRAARSW
ncbi:MAG: hypothetical protein ACYTGX_19415 [Planctomycetota bacterium]